MTGLYIGTLDDSSGPYRVRLYAEQRTAHWIAYDMDSAFVSHTSKRLYVDTPAEVVRECQKLFSDRNLKLGKTAREYLEGKR